MLPKSFFSPVTHRSDLDQISAHQQARQLIALLAGHWIATGPHQLPDGGPRRAAGRIVRGESGRFLQKIDQLVTHDDFFVHIVDDLGYGARA